MKLLKEVISKRIQLYNEAELDHQYLKAIWHFYAIYNICLVITDKSDNNLRSKNKLMQKLVFSSIQNLNMKLLRKMLNYVKQDTKIINDAMQIIQNQEVSEGVFGDYDIPEMVAISIND